jgi:peptidoglycan DL-endopeptidase CwlO
VATQQYNAAQERTDKQQTTVDHLPTAVARRTEKLNEARRTLGLYADAQYRDGGLITSAVALLFSADPQDFLDQTHLLDRLTGRQEQVVDEVHRQAAAASAERTKAATSLASLTASQQDLRTRKRAYDPRPGLAAGLRSRAPR